jgi:tRNA wybutosine-synthesizing protein 1
LPKWDSPEEIAEGSIKAQQRILSGYKGNPRTNKKKLREARVSKHVAISLTGEPTLYEHIGRLIEIFHTRGLTTFLVTNGTVPSALKRLNAEPTQLYISVCAPNKEVYKRVCRPKVRESWEKLNETLTLLPSLRCPKVMRITSVRGLNMTDPESYARLIEKSKTTNVEVKAYMHVGFSRLRLDYKSMPTHDEILGFSKQLAKETGYYLVDESRESRVVLLSALKKPFRFGNG